MEEAMKAKLVSYEGKLWRPFEYYGASTRAILFPAENGTGQILVFVYDGKTHCGLLEEIKGVPIGMTGNVGGSWTQTIPADKFKETFEIEVPDGFLKQARLVVESRRQMNASKKMVDDFAKAVFPKG